ncbi:hypothetical protein GGTG_09065 [Gaeumannomyces tritici R3-111a-1]|uniref:Phosphatidylethanolamine-binding protein n=1 Tax=Gaeumannomyces tritici (strain R3-111a-1) TaxID=644352 RepID=J3P6C4_GAET3|nr:hypothetical protein GGTG_09065 [Gaeumannomyces tritici R3-111a-1]EJT72198.1 hypothetical protein GGTG_09065 [Gaeumannomyces tritici R3-111a-1]
MQLSILTLAAGLAPVLAIPPTEFGLPASAGNAQLSVAFTFNRQTTVIQPAQLLGSNISSAQPELAIDPKRVPAAANMNGNMVVLMIDPDAPTPGATNGRTILHMLATGVRLSAANGTGASNSSAALRGQRALNFAATRPQVPYAPPAPPPTSSAHRYILYAFAEPAGFRVPAAFSNFSATNRAGFNIQNFLRDAKISSGAVAANYFYVSRQTQVPGTFTGQPGGTFPGGNGNAIFAGRQGGNGTRGPGRGNGTVPTIPRAEAPRAAAAMTALLGAVGLAVSFVALV